MNTYVYIYIYMYIHIFTYTYVCTYTCTQCADCQLQRALSLSTFAVRSAGRVCEDGRSCTHDSEFPYGI